MDKADYIRALLAAVKASSPKLLEAALLYWHSGIPLAEAKQYIQNLAGVLNSR